MAAQDCDIKLASIADLFLVTSSSTDQANILTHFYITLYSAIHLRMLTLRVQALIQGAYFNGTGRTASRLTAETDRSRWLDEDGSVLGQNNGEGIIPKPRLCTAHMSTAILAI